MTNKNFNIKEDIDIHTNIHKDKELIEIIFYEDGNCYYNYKGISYDMDSLNNLKTELKEKFNYNFVKTKEKSYFLGRKQYYNIYI